MKLILAILLLLFVCCGAGCEEEPQFRKNTECQSLECGVGKSCGICYISEQQIEACLSRGASMDKQMFQCIQAYRRRSFERESYVGTVTLGQ